MGELSSPSDIIPKRIFATRTQLNTEREKKGGKQRGERRKPYTTNSTVKNNLVIFRIERKAILMDAGSSVAGGWTIFIA